MWAECRSLRNSRLLFLLSSSHYTHIHSYPYLWYVLSIVENSDSNEFCEMVPGDNACLDNVFWLHLGTFGRPILFVSCCSNVSTGSSKHYWCSGSFTSDIIPSYMYVVVIEIDKSLVELQLWTFQRLQSLKTDSIRYACFPGSIIGQFVGDHGSRSITLLLFSQWFRWGFQFQIKSVPGNEFLRWEKYL